MASTGAAAGAVQVVGGVTGGLLCRPAVRAADRVVGHLIDSVHVGVSVSRVF
jgi:hypothetical protein